MAENKVDLTVIKRTQDSLGKYIKKPPLTEKLLKKPPFRFLYDVFNAVIKETGCFEGLYTAEEQNIENIKDRDDKMKYLQKMIDVIKIATNRAISVRTSKIVAGQEPEKTNELLQLLGEVIEKKLDWRSAVDSVRHKSSSPTKPHKALEKTKEKNAKSKEQSRELRKELKTSTRISPTKKEEQKSKPKNSSPKEKLKTDAKSTKEKQAIETRDKASKKSKDPAEKSKPVKSKTVKDKTPSPKDEPKIISASEEVPNIPKEEENKRSDKPVTPPKDEPKIISASEDVPNIPKEEENKRSDKPVTPPKDTVTSPIQNQDLIEAPVNAPANALQDQRSAVRNSEPVINKTTNNEIHTEHTEKESPKKSLTYNTTTNEVHTEHLESDSPKKSGSRKSSANRKSSGRSRRSSANKIRNDENEATQGSINQQESLNTLNEEEAPKSVPSMDTQISALEQPKPSVESPKLLDNATHNVKRESTFTRENSKDSNNNRPRTSLRPPSARPASARPGAPRRRDRNVEIVLQPNDQIKMSGVNVKLETFGDFGDDGENLVIIENTNVDETLGELGSKSASATDNNLQTENNMEKQGHLVQQILETQKELVQQNRDLTGRQDKDSEVSSGINMRQSSARQMNNLRDVIQNLTKSVNPFGKLMDFIPEDIDAMQLELTMWRDSYTQTANELRKEKSLTESVTEPMKNQLIQIEANIKEYQEIIDASHNKILQNSEKILKMLTEQ